MLTENMDYFYYGAMALTLAFLVVRMLRRDEAAAQRIFRNPFKKSSGKRELAILAFKNCPQCNDQLPVSTLVCDGCDYNFLASSILRHKLLPAPTESVASPSQQAFASHA